MLRSVDALSKGERIMSEPKLETETQSATTNHLDQPRITIQPNGAYIVSGKVKLTRRIRILNAEREPIAWETGEDYLVADEPYKLCRCGLSKTKPFCDDAHETAPESEWVGTVTASHAPRSTRQKIYQGSEIVMSDDAIMCAGYAFCDRYGTVWKEMHQSSDPEVRAHIKEQVSLCPSGRLQYMLALGEEAVEIKYEPMIAVIRNGPYWVLGGIPIEAPDGKIYEVRNRQLLCRCGKSKNKPFCDGTHWDIKFRAA